MTIVSGDYGAGVLAEARERVSALAAAASRFLVGSVPAITGETLAVARAFFGGSILFFWLKYSPPSLGALAAGGPRHDITRLLDQAGFLTFLSASGTVRDVVYWSIAWLLIAFMLGVLTRFLYPLLVGLIWLAAFMQGHGHFITPLLLALTVTIGAPWSDRWSVDSLLSRREKGPSVASPIYGYAVWLLGFTIGLTYCVAGLSKIVITDGAWLWETGARMGFVQDLRSAVTDWGMAVSNNYLLALVASIHSALGQMVYVWASFTRSPVIKYGIGLFIALPFLVGLVLLMGLFWWPWFVLVLVLYCPWPTIDRMTWRRGRTVMRDFAGSVRGERHRTWFLTSVTGLVLIHAYAVVTKREYDPLYSNYPMYAARLLAGSQTEKEFWAEYRAFDRHFKYSIQLILVDPSGSRQSVRDLSGRYSIGYFFRDHSLWRADIVRLQPSLVIEQAADAKALDQSTCERLQGLAATLALPGTRATALQYAKRYYDIVHGTMEWLPVDRWLEVDVTRPGCPYRFVADKTATNETASRLD